MNVTYLKYAVEVARAGSISKAAQQMYMNQPNLSKAIKELEKDLAITIFQRSTTGVVPTAEGADFLLYAENILQQLEAIEHKYKTTEQKITFAISVPRASYITYAFAEFVNTFAGDERIELNFRETNTVEAIENVYNRENQIAIIRYPVRLENYYLKLLASKELAYREIWQHEYVLLFSGNSVLAQQECVTLADLQCCTQLAHGDSEPPFLPVAHRSREEKDQETPKKIYLYERGSQFDFLNSIQDTYIWVSPVPAALLKKNGLQQRFCCDGHTDFKDVLIYPKNHRLSQLEEEFWHILVQVKDELLHQEGKR